MGSTVIWDLKYRESFAFIGTLGRKECQEKKGANLSEKVQLTWVLNVKRKWSCVPQYEKDAVTDIMSAEASRQEEAEKALLAKLDQSYRFS